MKHGFKNLPLPLLLPLTMVVSTRFTQPDQADKKGGELVSSYSTGHSFISLSSFEGHCIIVVICWPPDLMSCLLDNISFCLPYFLSYDIPTINLVDSIFCFSTEKSLWKHSIAFFSHSQFKVRVDEQNLVSGILWPLAQACRQENVLSCEKSSTHPEDSWNAWHQLPSP